MSYPRVGDLDLDVDIGLAKFDFFLEQNPYHPLPKVDVDVVVQEDPDHLHLPAQRSFVQSTPARCTHIDVNSNL